MIRTRFAPSPTGYLHIGGARTALYNYLLARKTGGVFILRVEDTDRERSTDEAIQAILDGMKWLELDFDEGPFFQTRRYDFYNEHIDRLLKEHKAYPCFCSPEALEEKRQRALKREIKYKYDRTCWCLSKEERQKKISENIPYCVRFYSPDEKSIVLEDLIKGRVEVDAKELDDLILRRTDGHPTYNLSVVVDDALMKITHVIRGDDHLNNTFRQIQLYHAFGYALPKFAHCSMILGNDGKKLSKRHGATGVMAYREMGYLPQAIKNYLVRLGWSYKDQEIFSMQEMIEKFDLESVSSSAAIFNTSKLDWLNGHYIRESNPKDLIPVVKEFLEKAGAININETLLEKSVKISLEKVKTLKEMTEFIDFIFIEKPVEEETVQKNINEKSLPVIQKIYEALRTVDDFTHDTLKTVFEKIMVELNLGMGKVANPIRVCLSGRKISPGALDLLEIFGKEKSLKKIQGYLKKS